jgi:hypothetical protein
MAGRHFRGEMVGNLMNVRTSIASKIVNFRFGGCDQGFEDRAVNEQAGDESCTLVSNADGTWSVRSPNGAHWLSIQENGSWESRDANWPPYDWEKFTRQGNVLTELHKPGITRLPITLIGSVL